MAPGVIPLLRFDKRVFVWRPFGAAEPTVPVAVGAEPAFDSTWRPLAIALG